MIEFSGNPAHGCALKLAGAAIVAGLAALLAGCPSQSSEQTSAPSPTAAAVAFHGTLFGGRQPIVGSTITVYAASPTAGAPATPIGSATTDTSGHFTIATFSPVPASGAIIYVVATGGDATGQTPPVLNSAIELATVAGPYCTSENPACFPATVNINELTTAAMAYSLAGFTSLTGGIVNVSGGNPGLANAARTFASLADSTTGQAVFQTASACTGSGEPVNCGPLRALNTLANVAATCVNAQDGATSTQCNNLFSQTTPSGGSAPADTFTALYNVATVPAVRNNASGVYGLAPTGPIYAPALTTAPNAWVLAIAHPLGDKPVSIAIDSHGNIWSGEAWLGASNVAGMIQKLDPIGTVILTNTNSGVLCPYDLAVDADQNLWVPRGCSTQLAKFDSTGAGPTFYSGGALNRAAGVAIDPAGNVWTASYSNSTVNEFSSSGSPLSPESGFTGGGLNFPNDIAIDASAHVWTVGYNTLNEFGSDGTPLSPESGGFSGGGLFSPHHVAVGPAGHIWTAGRYSITKFASDGTVLVHSDNPGGGYGTENGAKGMCIDAAGTVWIVGGFSNAVSEFDSSGNALSPSTGYTGGRPTGTATYIGIAVDPSGNLWVARYSQYALTEFIGIAAPTRTPIIAAITQGFTP